MRKRDPMARLPSGMPVSDWLEVGGNPKILKLKPEKPSHFSEARYREEVKGIPGLTMDELVTRRGIAREMLHKERDPETKARIRRLWKMYRNIVLIRKGE